MDQDSIRPSLAAAVTHYLSMNLADVVEHELSGSGINRRTYLKLFGLSKAAEFFAGEAAGFHGGLLGDNQDALEALETLYLAEQAKRGEKAVNG